MRNMDFLINKTIAHRGIFDNKKIPENSIKAFMKAISGGYIIEFDVHLTKDNKIVVFHDVTLNRMTSKRGKISDYTLEELKKFKLLGTNNYIPSLDEVLDLVNGKVPLLIEIKSTSNKNELSKLLIEKLEKYNGEFAIQSFDPLVISYFKKHKSDFIRGLLIGSFRNNVKNILINNILLLPFSILICKPDFLSVDKRLYKNKRIIKYKNKLKLLSWTMKSKEDVNKYKDKFDNIICNISDCT